MKKIIITTLFLFSAGAWAQQSGTYGLGLMIGNPTGISGKYWRSQDTAMQVGLAFDFDDSVMAFGDYLLHYPGSIQTSQSFLNSLNPYWGVGVLVAVTTDDRSDDDQYLGEESGDFGAGIRIPLGVELQLQDPTIGFFLEIAPGISVAPETSGFILGGIGARYYF